MQDEDAGLALHRLDEHRHGGVVDRRLGGGHVVVGDDAETGSEWAWSARAVSSVEAETRVIVRPGKLPAATTTASGTSLWPTAATSRPS